MKISKHMIGLCFCLLIYILILKYLFSILFPFLLAILCFFLLKPFIDKIEKYIPLQKSAIGISLLLLIYMVMAFVFGTLTTYAFLQIIRFCHQLPAYYDSLFLPFLSQINILFHDFLSFLPYDLLTLFQNWINQNFMNIVTFASQFLTHIPTLLFSFFLFVISTFFLVLDYENMKNCFLKIVQKKTVTQLVLMKERIFKSLGSYVKCQMILMVITFLILWTGFWILKITPSFLYAFTVSLLDSLPFIGVGIALIPMMIFMLLQEHYISSFYVLCLYLMINMVRSILEPHIMNKELKVPSFLLLVSMVLHLHFFGLIGIILSPIHMSVLYQYLREYHHFSS